VYLHVCGLYGPQNKEQFSPFTVLTSFFYIGDKKCFTALRLLALYIKSKKGQANKLVTIKRKPELYSENQQVETSNSEAHFCFFTYNLAGFF
jgi:hypothetical protein